MTSRELAMKHGLKIYKDDNGEIRYVISNRKFIRKDPARAEAREIGLPYYNHADGTLRSVRTNAVITEPMWDHYGRETYTTRCKKHGMCQHYRSNKKCVRCEKRY